MRTYQAFLGFVLSLVGTCGVCADLRPASQVLGLNARLGVFNAISATPPVSLGTEIRSLFSAAPAACGITGKAKEKLERSNSTPSDIQEDLKVEMTLTVRKIDSTYVRPLLFQISKGGKPYTITGASAFNSLDPFLFTDINQDNYIYTLDCSGYLTTALSAKLGLKIAEAELAAGTASQKQWSMLIARARLWSPVVHAISPMDAPIKSPNAAIERLDVLWAVHSQFQADEDSVSIEVPTFMDFLWMSRNGSASFQGKVDMSDNINAGFGSGNSAGKFDVGAALGRASRFSSFMTYPLPSSDNAPLFTASLGSIRERVRDLVSQAGGVTSTDNSNIRVIVQLPQNLCSADLHWQLTDSKNSQLPAIVTKMNSETGCKFTIVADPSKSDSEQQLQKATFGFISTTESVGTLPLRFLALLTAQK